MNFKNPLAKDRKQLKKRGMRTSDVETENFHPKPILPFVSGNGHLCILTLSQNEIRLLQANRYHLKVDRPIFTQVHQKALNRS